MQSHADFPLHSAFFVLFQTPGRFLQRTYDGTTYESNYDGGSSELAL